MVWAGDSTDGVGIGVLVWAGIALVGLGSGYWFGQGTGGDGRWAGDSTNGVGIRVLVGNSGETALVELR